MEYEIDESYCFFGTKVMLKRLKTMKNQIDGVRKADDTKYIHDIRVASRRLQSALVLFKECFPKKKTKKWKKQIRRTRKGLGGVRDTDVQIEFLQEFSESFEKARYKNGINRLLLRLQQKREKLQKKVIKTMDKLETSGALEDMEASLRRSRVKARLNGVGVYSQRVYQIVHLEISVRLEEMLSYEPYVYQPKRGDKLHELRISAKRLRYTMEIFETLYNGDLKPLRKKVREIQNILGDIHDCDVWVEYLPKFLEEERERTLEYYGHTKPLSLLEPGILYLKQELQKKRENLYQDFVEFWEEQKSQNTWKNLGQVLKSRLEDTNSNLNEQELTEESNPIDENEE